MVIQHSDIMSVSATFKKSKTNMLIEFMLSKYGKSDDYDEIISHAQQEGWIKTSKAKDPEAPKKAKEPTEKGQSKWTAYQKWCKKWADWNDKTIDRKTMKLIYDNYSEAEKAEWQRVADELNKGANIRDIENKPQIRMPTTEESDVEENTNSEVEELRAKLAAAEAAAKK